MQKIFSKNVKNEFEDHQKYLVNAVRTKSDSNASFAEIFYQKIII
jgi:hypothetical protein